MNWTFVTPILLLCVSNVFMTFAWVRSGLPKANEMVLRTISSDERAELGRGAGASQSKQKGRPGGAPFVVRRAPRRCHGRYFLLISWC